MLNWMYIYIYINIHTLDCYPLKLTRVSYFGGRSMRGSLDCDRLYERRIEWGYN